MARLETIYVTVATLLVVIAVCALVVQEKQAQNTSDFTIVRQQALSVYTDILRFAQTSGQNDRISIIVADNTQIQNNRIITQNPETGEQESYELNLFVQGTSCVGENEIVRLTEGIAVCCGQCDNDVRLQFPNNVMCSPRQDVWLSCANFPRGNLGRVSLLCDAVSGSSATLLNDQNEIVASVSNPSAQWEDYLIFSFNQQVDVGDYVLELHCGADPTFQQLRVRIPSAGGGGNRNQNQTQQTTQCNDGIDNDNDGPIDLADQDCAAPTDNSENIRNTECNDGIDNDEDGYADEDDPDCENDLYESWVALAACSDGIDNDGDGVLDGNDPQCTTRDGYRGYKALDDSELISATNAQCSNGLDDDDDGAIDYPSDPGCGSLTDDEMGESPNSNLAFFFSQAGVLAEVNWTHANDQRQIMLWNGSFGQYYLHSSPVHSGWRINYTVSGNIVIMDHAELNYTTVQNYSDGALFSTRPINGQAQDFVILDRVRFHDDTIIITTTIHNAAQDDMIITVPFFFFGIQLGNHSATSLDPVPQAEMTMFIPESGDSIRENFNTNGYGEIKYPNNIGQVSPTIALWDNNFTIGLQLLSQIYGPEYYGIKPNAFTGSRLNPSLWSSLHIYLQPEQNKTYVQIIKIANSSDWQTAFSPYKQWFDAHYSQSPQYCPQTPITYSVGYNHAAYDATNDLFAQGSSISSIVSGNRSFMSEHGITHVGVWATAVHSRHITSLTGSCQDSPIGTTNSCEFSPTIDLISPRLAESIDPSGIVDFTDDLENNNLGAFWFARPCSEIIGANVSYGTDGNPVFTRGTVSGYNDVDLRNVTNRNRYLQRLQFLTDRGVKGFYFDATGCPGDEAFLQFAKAKLDPSLFIVVEGFRDRTSLWSPQIPFPKPGANGGVYASEHAQLLEYLSPHATYYGGQINNVLSDDEITDFVARGGQVVLSSWQFTPEHFASNTTKRQLICSWINQSYNNYERHWLEYGQQKNCLQVQIPSCE